MYTLAMGRLCVCQSVTVKFCLPFLPNCLGENDCHRYILRVVIFSNLDSRPVTVSEVKFFAVSHPKFQLRKLEFFLCGQILSRIELKCFEYIAVRSPFVPNNANISNAINLVRPSLLLVVGGWPLSKQ